MLSPEEVTTLFSGIARRAPSEAEIATYTPLPTEDAAIAQMIADVGLDTADVVTFYQTFYNRLPDAGGLDFWTAGARSGLTDQQLSTEFFAAGEFTALYGGLSAEEAVRDLYENILGREADAGGLEYWTGLVTDPDNGFGLRELGFEFASAPETAETFAPRIEDYLTDLAKGQPVPDSLFGYDGKPGEDIDFTGDDDKVTITEADFLVKAEDTIEPANQSVADIISLDDFRADPRFAGIDGSDLTVAVIDTGIDLDNTAFGPVNGGVASRIVRAVDFTGEADGTPDDVQGHGTHVSSIIASSNPEYLGIAPDANIAGLQGLGNDGSGSSSDIEQALQWVLQNAASENIVAVNMSLGNGTNLNQAGPHPFGYADELEALNDLGVIVIAAAGNDYFNYQVPGTSDLSADPNVISVGAVWDENNSNIFWGSGAKDFVARPDQITSFSQRATSPDIDTIFAPGALILGAAPGGGTINSGGTSQAAPQVAGLAALAQELALQELGRLLTPEEFEQILRDSADTITDAETSNDNVVNTGASFSRVNALRMGEAILALDGTPGEPPITPEPPEGDVPGDPLTTARLDVGGAVTGEIEIARDTDWYRISLVAGQSYEIGLAGATSGAGTLTDPFLNLLDESGRVIATDDDGGAGVEALLNVVAPVTGEYFVEARAYTTQTGTYRLSASGLDAGGDIPETPDTPSRLQPGTVTTGEIESAGDRDWHALDVVAGQVYEIELTGAQGGGGTLSDPYLRVVDASGTLLAENDDQEGLDSGLAFAAPFTGTVYVSAAAFADAGTGTYSISVGELGAGDVPGDPSTGGAIAPGQSLTGDLGFVGDTDWYAVTLNAGQRYDIELQGFASGLGDLSDPLVRLYDAAGSEVASDDDGGIGRESLLSVRPDTTGLFYIGAESYQNRYTGSYTLSVSTGSGPEIPDDVTTGATLGVGQSADGVLEEDGDADWYRVQLDAFSTYTATLEGAGSGAGDLPDALLRIYDSQGREITFDDDGGQGLDSELTYTPVFSGTYYLSAGSFGDFYSGSYRIALSEGGSGGGSGDAVPADPGTQARVAPGQSAAGELEFNGDRDWYGVQLTGGTGYRFDLLGSPSGAGTLSDPVLTLYGPGGVEIASDDDGGTSLESRLSFMPNQSGLYYLGAAGYNDARTGTYELAVTQTSGGGGVGGGGGSGGDVPNDFTTDARLPAGGSVTGEIGFVGDDDWFVFEAQARTGYIITLRGEASGAGSLPDPVLTIYDSAGGFFDFDDDGGTGFDSRLELVVGVSQRLYVSASGFGDATGTYRLQVSTDQGFPVLGGRSSAPPEDVAPVPAEDGFDFGAEEAWPIA